MRESWSDREILTLKQRWAKGDNASKIGAILQRTPDSVKAKLRRLRLPSGNQRHPVMVLR